MSAQSTLKLIQNKNLSGENHKRFVGELWTAQQRQMHSLHYIVSYRASFKPELPDYCLKRFSKKGDIVLDPFSGRGTTLLQANLLGRVGWGADVNPFAVKLTQTKTNPVGLDEIVLRMNEINLKGLVVLQDYPEKFEPFYHIETFRELINLKNFIHKNPDRVNNFIELLAISRLHGHSPGFFSVYSFPQISIPSIRQRRINIKRGQIPEYRAVAPRIIKKAAQALRDGFSSEFFTASAKNQVVVSDSRNLSWVPSNTVDLIITSPPFLDKVDYIADNWLEYWFCGVESNQFSSQLVMCSGIEDWQNFIKDVLKEMLRVLKHHGHAVIEVGEVEVNGKVVFLDEIVVEEARKIAIRDKRFVVEEILINQQKFTKLANCFNVENNRKGTNTNRLVILKSIKVPSRSRSTPIR